MPKITRVRNFGGTKDDRTVYYVGDIVHRTNGPAVILDDGKWGWKLYNEYHRYYGPRSEEHTSELQSH